MSKTKFNEAKDKLVPIAEIYGIDANWLTTRILDYFGTLNFEEKRILEIGAGDGLYACSLACLGAQQVIALEPELDGSRNAITEKFTKAIDALGIDNTDFRPISMEEFNSEDESFDLIFMLAVINHVHEELVPNLDTDPKAQQRYIDLMAPLFRWLKPKGELVVTDVSNWHLFMPLINLGLMKKHPFQPKIEWEIHQPPKLWIALLEKVGFTSTSYHWATNWRYRWIPRFLVDNPIAAQIYSSLFVIYAQKP